MDESSTQLGWVISHSMCCAFMSLSWHHPRKPQRVSPDKDCLHFIWRHSPPPRLLQDAMDAKSPARQVLFISAGSSHSVALLSGNIVCSWGRGADGQLGHGNVEDQLISTLLSTLNNAGIVSLVCGADHTTAYSESELQVYSWGWGDFERLGHGNSSDVFTPQPIKALQGIMIKQIACGDSHCLAVTMDGEVQSWGRNQNGQLGLGTTEDSLVPRKIQAFQGIPVKMIAAGAEHTAAVTQDGELYGWGWGRYGNLGLGDRNDRLIPEKVSSINGIKMVLVACGWRHTITVSSSGSLYTFGWSKYGQLGHRDFEDHLVPHQVEALKHNSISQISGGWRHTMAVTSDGKLYGWGWNKFGQVGVGDDSDHCSPLQVKFPDEQKVVNISCGWRHTLAVTEWKNIFSWGRGTSGQLGHGDTLDRNTPKMIEVLSADGSACKQIDSSKIGEVPGKVSVLPSERYAIVPDEKVMDCGMTASFLDEVRNVAKEFFQIPMEEKQKYSNMKHGKFHYQGYGNDEVITDDQILDWTDRLISQYNLKI